MQKLTLFLLLLLGWFQYSLWFGKNGVYDLVQIKRNITEQKNSNAQLKIRNNQLFLKIDDFKNNQEAIEEHSRNVLGMIKPGEKLYRLLSKQNKLKSIMFI
ncbi:Cell division protein FtsB [Candidatus Gullanella endobia]|uniref:Cell division protein FtsB n=1 Tax=Candidatus Gullanella endobia TaxID=1070130 RepID=A0A143WT78_9ENTR|nr:cell division protein FtsB [Candidatus Gullanella endobia]CUX96069.1 Cell division protein FtsB [Candidatus Gullanella endobia]